MQNAAFQDRKEVSAVLECTKPPKRAYSFALWFGCRLFKGAVFRPEML